MKMTIRNSVRGLLFIPLLVACFALLPAARAVVPAPDGAYPGFNTAEGGPSALGQAAPGVWNTAIGQFALNLDVAGGTGNTAVGLNALRFNSTGDFNSALGVNALRFNGLGSNNTALGFQALFVNTASSNTAVGVNALSHNTTGGGNSAVGQGALGSNTSGVRNAALGFQALAAAVGAGATDNTAVGWKAAASNDNVFGNTAVGSQALIVNTGGSANTANGAFTLLSDTTGDANTAVGFGALFQATGGFNIGLGLFAGQNVLGATGVIAIGANGANVSNTTYIGNIYTTVQPVVGINPDFVTINSAGRLGRANLSSRRYKHDIKPMDTASEALFKLKPVSFRYNQEFDATQTVAFGLIAEDVAQVYPDLVGRNPEGQPESVRYEQINAMLLNEFLKEHRKVEEQQASIAELKSTVALQQKGMEVLTAQLKEQASQIQKVSAQLEVNKPAPRTVDNK